jgi:hypothetical protein
MIDFARRGIVAALLAVSLIAVSHRADGARQAPPAQAQAVRQAPAAPQVQVPPTLAPRVVAPADADQTREALRELLSRYSPTIGRVLALDPTLLQNPVYLEPYPELVAFLQQHPEVARNGADFLSDFRPSYYREPDHATQVIRMWQNLFQGVAIFMVFGLVTGTLAWLVKTLVDYRRWYRLSKVQTEAHNKLLDRFTANDELLAYIATPSGKRFLESAPIMLDISPASIGAPLKRILWAVEIGVVMVCLGGGSVLAANNLPTEVSQVLIVVSILVTALGIGFVLAAAATYLLSRRLGVLGGAASRQTGDVDAQPGA